MTTASYSLSFTAVLTAVILVLFMLRTDASAFKGSPEAEHGTVTSEAPRVMFSDFRKYQIHRQNAEIPEDLKALDGQEISVIGYMVPFDRIENITQFILLQAPFMGCMHVPPPQANETLMIETARPLSTYTYEPLRVTGTLNIDEVFVEGFLVSVYTITNARVSSGSSSDVELDGLPDNFHFYGDL
ncbi:Protein of unknown function (DUF3299) [Cyclonatronum proteinivorum]|uniref:DUF3299 domain-containing protein n=1 Tax=Cyclonatronum proteinivorum TaxID=1457365 RepID=A0A345UKD2_9BACT|nr:DUF3299 domain-containing protein [Cyclonatronum proteinivorum]AXJ00934.1 Protein of unknown function (DUF3299) [Cyclonatronum proteinivorum]